MNVSLKELFSFIVILTGFTLFFWLLPIVCGKLSRLTLPKSPRLEKAMGKTSIQLDKIGKRVDKITFRLKNIFLFPLRLLWNLLVTLLIIKAFILWYGFIFGSVVGVILLVIFVPREHLAFAIFGLPLLILPMYTKMWDKEDTEP